MLINTISQNKWSLIFSLSSIMQGKFKPHSLWGSKKFRIKFFLRVLLSPFFTIYYFNQLIKLPNFNQILLLQELLLMKPYRPYLHIGLNRRQRIQAIINNYKIIEELENFKLRQLFENPVNTLLANFKGKNDKNFSIYFSAGYFDREGEYMLNIHYQSKLVALLSFSIIWEKKQKILFIGGLQGPKKHIPVALIREATKSTYGLFPKRILLEVIFILASFCNLHKIIAVSDNKHVYKSLRYRHHKNDKIFASYSDFWFSMGGQVREDDLFILPMCIEHKCIEMIASKKRSQYRCRYILLDNLKKQIYQNLLI